MKRLKVSYRVLLANAPAKIISLFILLARLFLKYVNTPNSKIAAPEMPTMMNTPATAGLFLKKLKRNLCKPIYLIKKEVNALGSSTATTIRAQRASTLGNNLSNENGFSLTFARRSRRVKVRSSKRQGTTRIYKGFQRYRWVDTNVGEDIPVVVKLMILLAVV